MITAACQPIVPELSGDPDSTREATSESTDATVETIQSLFKTVPPDDSRFDSLPPTESATITRSRIVELESEVLENSVIIPSADSLPADPVVLNLFDDIEVTLVTERVESVSPDTINLVGEIPGDELSNASFVINDSNITGNVIFNATTYQIRPASDGLHVITEINQEGFPDEKEPIVPDIEDSTEKDSSPDAQSDMTPVIDLLVVYTSDAAEAAADAGSNIEIEIAVAMLETNTSYEKSNVNQRVWLVHSEEIAYSESGDIELDLERLQSPNDNFMDDIHTLRDEFGADLVSLWVANGGNYCGIAYLMQRVSADFEAFGFSVVDLDCATGKFSFGHELGHNMGARHDCHVDNDVGNPFAFNHGYANPDAGWRTIMAYNRICSAKKTYCNRIQRWSNPALQFDGEPLGFMAANNECSANNKATLDATATTIADFRTGNSRIEWNEHEGWGIAIAVTPNGQPWAINSAYQVFEPKNGVFVLDESAPKARDIAIGPKGKVWIIGEEDGIYLKRDDGEWNSYDGWGIAIAVAPNGQPWVINSAGQVWERKNGVFVLDERAPKARDIAIGPKGKVWIIGEEDRIYLKRGDGEWNSYAGWGIAIAVAPNGQPWVINSKGQLWERDSRNLFVMHYNVPNSGDIGIGSNGSIWITGGDQPFTYSGELPE